MKLEEALELAEKKEQEEELIDWDTMPKREISWQSTDGKIVRYFAKNGPNSYRVRRSSWESWMFAGKNKDGDLVFYGGGMAFTPPPVENLLKISNYVPEEDLLADDWEIGRWDP